MATTKRLDPHALAEELAPLAWVDITAQYPHFGLQAAQDVDPLFVELRCQVKFPGVPINGLSDAEIRSTFYNQAENLIALVESKGWHHMRAPRIEFGGDLVRSGWESHIIHECEVRLESRAVKIGVGLVSYGREDYRKQAIAAIDQHLNRVDDPTCVHELVVVEDVSPVARAKNQVLTTLMDAGCDWLFVSEDDVLVTSRRAVTGYLAAVAASGIHHLCFHAHGPANPGPGRWADPTGMVTYWPNYVGAWCLYSRRSIERCGMFDEEMVNAFEHVEHTLRLAEAGFCPYPASLGEHQVADATGSELWLSEIPGSIENSSILADGGMPAQRVRALLARQVWKKKRPDTYAEVFAV